MPRTSPSFDAPETQIAYSAGASITELGQMFEMDRRTVTKRLMGLSPIGHRQGHAVFNVKAAAQRLADPPHNLVERVLAMHHTALPPLLRKEYWAGKIARTQYLQLENRLWSTEQVVEYCGAALQHIRAVIALLPDTLERDLTLNMDQMETVQGAVDRIMREARTKLKDEFEARLANDKRTIDNVDEFDPHEL